MRAQKTIKYFAYVRKSSEGQERQALSIPAQKDRISEIFKELDIEFLEESRSAFNPHNRPVFSQMIERIHKGERTGLIAWHPDRLSRNEVDAGTITYLIRTGVIEDLKFASYNFENTPEGIWMIQMALSQSQYDSAKKSRDVKRGLKLKIKQGWLPGVAPTGYLNTPDAQKCYRTVIPDPERFDLVRKMWDLMLTGNYTPPQILKIVNEQWGFKTVKRKKEGGKPLARSTIYKIFTNPFYYGYFEHNGELHQGLHKPMITKEEFDRVQILLGRKGRPASQSREFPFTGQIFCADCGAQVTAEVKQQCICSNCKCKFSTISKKECPKCNTAIDKMKEPKLLNYTYYHGTKRKNPNCQNCKQHIRAEELEKQIDAYLARIQINEKYLQWAIKHLKKAHQIETVTRKKILNSQQKEYTNLSAKLDRLLELRMNNEITEEEYKTQKAKLMQEKQKYHELLNDTNERQNKWLELTEKTFNFCCYARYWFAKGDPRTKREILATLGSNLTLKDKKLNIQASEPFMIIEQGLQQVPEAKAMFEPTIFGEGKRKKEPVGSLNPRWLRGWDSNPRPIG